ncbi:MAG TPA: hypothetical protein VFR42_07680 [Candidatus Acidoferrum sp.]|nr:hypothetical protein [Candidatus Acidoferrum sp.]
MGYFEPFGKAAGKEMVFRIYGVECFLLGCGAILAISLLFVRKKYSGVILSGALAWICLLILTYFQPLPTIDSWFSARAVASTVLRDSQMAADVRTLGLQRAWQFGLNFYLHRPLREWDVSEPRGYVIASASGMEELNRKRLRFEVLNETSFQAFLIRVGGSQNGPLNADVSGVRKETVEMMNRERLPSHPPGSGQPQ